MGGEYYDDSVDVNETNDGYVNYDANYDEDDEDEGYAMHNMHLDLQQAAPRAQHLLGCPSPCLLGHEAVMEHY